MAVAFDTLRYAQRLRQGGVPQEVAEVHAGALADFVGFELVTKDDLLPLATKADMEGFATEADLERFATKADLERFATKADLERFATKADLERLAHHIEERFATKADLERLAQHIEERFATKADLDNLAAGLRADLQALETRLTVRFGSGLAVAVGAMAAIVKLL